MRRHRAYRLALPQQGATHSARAVWKSGRILEECIARVGNPRSSCSRERDARVQLQSLLQHAPELLAMAP